MNDLLQISFQAGGLAVLVLITNQLLSRWLPPRVRYTLWFLVVIRLLLWAPVTDPFAVQRPNWWTWNTTSTGGTEIAVAQPASPVEATSPGHGGIRISVNHEANGAAQSQADGPQVASNAQPQSKPQSKQDAQAEDKASSTPLSASVATQPRRQASKRATPAAANPLPPANNPSQAPQQTSRWWFWLWLSGAVVMLVRAVGSEWNLRRNLKSKSKPAPQQAQQLVRQCAELCGMKQTVQVLETDLVTSPAAYGLLQAKILLPINGWRELDAEERELVILHELAHLKHKDAWMNWLTAVLSAVHWFNPAIHLAFARLRAEREVVRDCEAIAARPGVEATRYAATILKMAPRVSTPKPHSSLSAMVSDQKTTRKRITMIMKNHRFKKPHLLLGASTIALLGWVGLTQASASEDITPTASTSTEPAAVSAEQTAVRITRQTPEPEWLPALEQALEQPVVWDKTQNELDEWANLMHEATGVRIYGAEGAFDSSTEVFVPVNKMPLRVALELICWQHMFTFNLMPDGVQLNEYSELTGPMDLRFYDVRPLVQGDEERADNLINLLEDLKPMTEVWRHGSEVRYWDGQLLVKQSDDVHQRIEQMINLLLTGENPKAVVPAAQVSIALDMPIVLAHEDYSIDELFEALTELTGLQFLLHDECDPDTFSMEVSDAPLRAVLDSVARRLEMRYQVWNDVVCFGYQLPLETRSYSVGDLIEPSQESAQRMIDEVEASSDDMEPDDIREYIQESLLEMKWQKMDELEELIVSMVNQSSWEDVNGCRFSYWDDRIIVTQLPATHQSIQSFLQAARRATQ